MSDSDKPKGPDTVFTDADRAALSPYVQQPAKETAAKKDAAPSADTIITLCRENPQGVFEEQIITALAGMTVAEVAMVKTALKGRVVPRDIDNAIKDYRKRNGLLRVVRTGNGGPRLTDLVPGCPLDAALPDSWRMTDEGVFEMVTRTGESGFTSSSVEHRFPVPIVLTAILEPMDGGDDAYSYEIAWLAGGRWLRTAMDGSALFDRARLTAAANFGLPVDSENSKGLLRWMGALRDTKDIPHKQVVKRCGWHGKQFVWGKQISGMSVLANKDTKVQDEKVQNAVQSGQSTQSNEQEVQECVNSTQQAACTFDNDWQSDDLESVPDNQHSQYSQYIVNWSPKVHSGEQDMIDGLCSKGTLAAQRKFLIEVCRRFSIAGFLVGASCAVPLLRLLRDNSRLDISGFSVEVVSDESGIGKTTGNVIAASIWGQPSKLIRYCNRTGNVGWEAWRHVFSDLPIFAEEAQLLKPEEREKIIYDQSQGMGKERGNRDGSLRATKRFYNIALVSSEESLGGASAHEGANTRLISLPPMFPKRDPRYGAESERIQEQCNTNYGHAGREYIKYLLSKISHKKTILQKFDEIENMLRESVPEDIPGDVQSIAFRLSSRVATCGLGLWLLMDSLTISPEDNAVILNQVMETVWKLVLRSSDAVSVWKKALVVIQSWAAENTNRIAGMEPAVSSDSYKKRIPDTYIGKLVEVKGTGQCICFYSNAFSDTIKKHMGKDPLEIQKAFIREKISIPDNQGHSTRYEKSGGKRGIFIPINIVFPDSDE